MRDGPTRGIETVPRKDQVLQAHMAGWVTSVLSGARQKTTRACGPKCFGMLRDITQKPGGQHGAFPARGERTERFLREAFVVTSCTKTRLKVCQGVDSRESRAFGLTATGGHYKGLFPGERQRMQAAHYMSRQITCDLLNTTISLLAGKHDVSVSYTLTLTKPADAMGNSIAMQYAQEANP